jgi:hypothetical protein
MSDNISKLFQIEHNCKNCESKEELKYIITNQTREIVEYEQAILLSKSIDNKLKVSALSDVAVVDKTSPLVQYITRVANTINKNKYEEITSINLQDSNHEQDESFAPHILWIPLKSIKDGIEVEYYMMLTRHTKWHDNDVEMIRHLAISYRYFLYAMRKCSIATRLQKHGIQKKHFIYTLVSISIIMLLPIQMSILASFEVKPKEPYIVTSSIDGAIDKILVKSNQKIKEGTQLIALQEIDYKNRLDIAQRNLDIAKATLHSIKQVSFNDFGKSSDIKRAETEVMLKEAELEYAKSQYDKTKIYAKKSGLVIVDNPEELEGKPVSIGERILSIANEKSIEVKIMLPVSEAIYLDGSNRVRLFFDNTLFDTWEARLSQISYTPQMTPEGIISYKLIANFDDINQNDTIPKIGLRGVAKIYAEDTTLFYYLFRKPITYMRQLIAW